MTLPITAILPDLVGTLAVTNRAVVIAPPGAGKTTGIAPALIGQTWCTGQIWLLSPRRVAARAAAEQMARMAGEPVGESIGYATRLDRKAGARTRILVLTEGIFRQRIIRDPELDGISAVLFDEVHERSLDSDVGLAFALEAQAAFRPDLRVIAMSATLDGARFAELLGNAPVLASEGRAHPVDVHHIGRDPTRPLEGAMVEAIRTALATADGDALAFLPGVREIIRTMDALAGLNALVLPLHGSLSPEDQRRALRADPEGRRKVVLATNIAETSVTIDGVRIVIDSGLIRRARFDQAAGMTRLVTERASFASIEQRAGRAGRQGSGTVWRLWEAAANGGLLPYEPPEMLEADLAPLLLDCALWGEAQPERLPWLDPPPAAALSEARKRLAAIGALAEDGSITAHGRAIAALPLPPPLAHMLVRAAAMGAASLAAEMAMLISERGLGGAGEDLEARLRRWRDDRSARATSARRTAQRWAELAGGARMAEPVSPGALVALAFPDRLARRRDARGEDWQSVGGRGFRLDPASSLATAEWLAVAEAQGAAGGARIMSAAAVEEDAVIRLFESRITSLTDVQYKRDSDRIEAWRDRRLGAIRLHRSRIEAVDPAERQSLLQQAVRDEGLAILPWSEASVALRQRAAFAGLPALEDAALMAGLDDWLLPCLERARSIGTIASAALHEALLGRLDWTERQRIDRIAPRALTTPAGSEHPIDYAAPGGPTAIVRVQALFGLDRHPCVGDPPISLVLSLTSPAGRPIQTTRDLPAFWSGSWADVAKEMRGRYPKHPWPDDPAAASATLRTKRAEQRR